VTPSFRRLWAAQSVSDLGAYASFVALPLVAVVQLDASATQMGLLVAAGTAPLAFAWPFFGVLADRVDRRRIMVAAHFGRCVLYAWIPVAAAAGILTMAQLAAVSFVANVLKVAFDVAYPSLVPALTGPDGLVAANSRLEATRSLAMVVGPAAGGLLVEAVRPSGVVAIDAACYLLAGLVVLTVRRPPPVGRPAGSSVARDVRAGLAAVFGHPLLRPMAISAGLMNAFFALRTPLLALFLIEELGFGPVALGVVLAAAGPGALAGSLLAPRLARRYGFGPTMVGAALLGGAPVLLVPLVRGNGAGALAVLVGSALAVGAGVQVYNVTMMAGRQAITPDHLLGRVTATFRWAAWAATPFAAAGGGLLTQVVGLRAAIAVAGIGLLLPAWRLFASPVRGTATLHGSGPGEVALEGAAPRRR
jgi:predicted MFS family arabinose efflux permease